MKTGFFLVLFCLTFSALSAQEKIDKFIFTKVARGFQQSLVIREDSTFINRRTNKGNFEKTTTTTRETWARLNKSIGQYSLKDLELLPSPTLGRQTDRAMISEIIIWTKEKKYDCGQFDDEDPHEKLKGLLDIMLESLK